MKLAKGLKCIGIFLFGLIAQPIFAQATGLNFSVTADPALAFGQISTFGGLDVYASGTIKMGDAERLASFVKKNDLEAGRIVFNSPGGSLLEGIKIGRLIRRLSFSTAIGAEPNSFDVERSGICASACAYAFAGGVLRYMPSDGGKLGLHQFKSASGESISEGDAQIVSAILVAYLTEMGVNSDAFAVASASSPDGMIWLSEANAVDLRFANNGVLPTTAEIQMINMRPYLWIGQSHPGMELRAILVCWNRNIELQAGVVTDSSQSEMWADEDWMKQSYIEFDRIEALALPGASGAEVQGSTVWLSRSLRPSDLIKFTQAEELGIWMDGYGVIRAGGWLDLQPVKGQLIDYVQQCVGS